MINAGESIALVGRSISANRPSQIDYRVSEFEGDSEILLDGVNIADYKLTDLRKQFALVSQQVVLFNDTNITLLWPRPRIKRGVNGRCQASPCLGVC